MTYTSSQTDYECNLLNTSFGEKGCKVWRRIKHLKTHQLLPKLLGGKDTQTCYDMPIFPLKIRNVGMNYLSQSCRNVLYIQSEHSIYPV
jgi:hypothetical protein